MSRKLVSVQRAITWEQYLTGPHTVIWEIEQARSQMAGADTEPDLIIIRLEAMSRPE